MGDGFPDQPEARGTCQGQTEPGKRPHDKQADLRLMYVSLVGICMDVRTNLDNR